jgi:hypothetical protein
VHADGVPRVVDLQPEVVLLVGARDAEFAPHGGGERFGEKDLPEFEFWV